MKTSVPAETMLLREPNLPPTKEVLKNALGGSYPLFDELMGILHTLEIIPEWNYYRDGKAWLCKAVYRKKTVFWLSVWDEYFRVTFYFNDRNCDGISGLDIDEKIKEDFIARKGAGKFMPLTMIVVEEEQIEDIIKVISYKKSLK